MKLLRFGAVAALLMAPTLMAAEAFKSGLQPGKDIGAFDVVKIAGATEDGVEEGKELCYRCKYGNRPMVMVFARKAECENLLALTKGLDEAVSKHEDAELKAFVNLLGESRDDLETTAKEFCTKAEVANVPVVVPVEFENGPGDYGLNPDAEVTIILAVKGKVEVNHAFAAGDLTEESVKTILEDVAKLIN